MGGLKVNACMHVGVELKKGEKNLMGYIFLRQKRRVNIDDGQTDRRTGLVRIAVFQPTA